MNNSIYERKDKKKTQEHYPHLQKNKGIEEMD